jgi:hypothetical protein
MTLLGMIYILNFMKIRIDIQAILRFGLSNLNSCKVDITDGRDLCGAPLRWGQVA